MRISLLHLAYIFIGIFIPGCMDSGTIVENTSNPYANYHQTDYDTVSQVVVIRDSVIFLDELFEITFDSVTQQFDTTVIDSLHIRPAIDSIITLKYDTQGDSTYYEVQPYKLVVNPITGDIEQQYTTIYPYTASTLDSIVFMENDSLTDQTWYIKVRFRYIKLLELDSFAIDTIRPFDTLSYDQYHSQNPDVYEKKTVSTTDPIIQEGSTIPVSLINNFASTVHYEIWRGTSLKYNQFIAQTEGYNLSRMYSGTLSHVSPENFLEFKISPNMEALIIIGFKNYLGTVEYLDHTVISSSMHSELFISKTAKN